MTAESVCSFLNCGRSRQALGLCMGHYLQQRRGAPLTALKSDVTLSDRMDRYTERGNGCWLWTGTRDAHGYGVINVAGRVRKAHRVAFELANGALDVPARLDHTCHTTACVRPDHLQPATAKQNAENRSGPTRASSSGVRGVYRVAASGKWVVKVRHHQRLHHGGSFSELADAEEAAIALRDKLFTNNLGDHPASALSSTTR